MSTCRRWIERTCALSALMMMGCGGVQPTGAGTTPVSVAPSIVITDPAEWQTLTVAGQSSFDLACGSCHPGGDADLGPSLKGEKVPVDTMTRQIREGSGRMKPIDTTQLPEDQMRGLLVYLSTLDAVRGVQGP